MSVRLQQRDKRAIVLLGAALALYIVVSWGVLPAVDAMSGAQAAATEKETLLQKYRQVAGRKGRYDSLLAEVNKQKELAASKMIQAANPSLAAVEFQTMIEGAARKFDINLIQRTVLPSSSTAEPREISLSLSFEGSPQKLVSFLTELRALPRAVRTLSLNVAPIQTTQEAPKSGPFSKDIRVGMTLGVWMQTAAKGGN